MKRQDIVETAFRVWGRNFYVNTSLSDLARELGVSKTAIYRHFRDKQALKDAMRQYFFDCYADYIREDFHRAFAAGDNAEALSIMIRIQTDYFARNPWALVFLLVEIYRDREPEKMIEQFLERGIDMQKHQRFAVYSAGYPSLIQMIVSSFTFWVAHFHKYTGKNTGMLNEYPREDDVEGLVSFVEESITCGLGLEREKTENLGFDALEASAGSRDFGNIEDGGLLEAVAGAVAEAGPWNASMDMVARRSGLSKSSLYGHFRNKQDMLRRLFMTEFTRIAKFAREGIKLSEVPEEQLYLGIFSIASYLRSRPEILIAIDWIRTRRLNLGRPASFRILRIFESIRIDALQGRKKAPAQTVSEWLVFLVVSILMRRPEGMEFADLPNESVRVLYRFIALGVEGFQIL
ncbi:MAG: TetR/AcrR family transcriptional regulator [Treponema sp.]|jgi:AcrR family transcriptional regulator|nr:TetR/AcrR family transcriptional regulator [Treponema sp.]